MEINEILAAIRKAAYEVRLNLSQGYLEQVYKNALVVELGLQGLPVECEVSLPVYYKNVMIGDYRADIIVDNAVIIELKAVRELTPIHEAQLVNYLNLTKIDYGFLINYGGERFRIIKKTRLYAKE